MFERRKDLVQFLAVADAGKIVSAADSLAITQPALSRAIARLEKRAGGRLFERMPDGVRLTGLGATAADRARRILREFDDAGEAIDAAVAGRAGRFRITAGPVWMQAVLVPAAAAFHERFPGIELRLRIAAFADGLRLLADGESDLHCGGIDAGRPLPDFLRRERFLDMTEAIVADENHPLQAKRPALADLAGCSWIDCGASVRTPPGDGQPSLDDLLDRLFAATGRRVKGIVRAGDAGLLLIATGPWLSWLPLELLGRLAAPRLAPLPLAFGRHRYRAGFIARRSAEDLPPFRALEETMRETALARRR